MLYVQAALRLLGSGPATLAAVSGLGARCATDRLIALVMKAVVWEFTLVDPLPQLPVGPVSEWVVLPETPGLVAFDQLGARPGGPLLAADPRDPAIGVGERTLERRHLRSRAAVLRPGPWSVEAGGVLHLDLDREPLLELPPGLEGLLEQHARVDGHDPHGIAHAVAHPEQLVDQHGLLLLEGAQQHGTLAVAIHRSAECVG